MKVRSSYIKLFVVTYSLRVSLSYSVDNLGWNYLSLVQFPFSVCFGIPRASPYGISSRNFPISQHIFVYSYTSLIMLLIDIIGYP